MVMLTALMVGCGTAPNRSVPFPSSTQSATASHDSVLDDRAAAVLKGLSGEPPAAPGAVVLIDNGPDRTNQAVGVAQISPAQSMNADARFRIGSVTKTFTATLILGLVGEGRLDLTDGVEKWLPGALPDGARITIRELLNHTSGIFNYTQDAAVRKSWGTPNVPPPPELVRIAASHPLEFEPGTRWQYSNTNYQVLGLIIERVSGHTLAEQLRDKIIKPLGLTRTSLESGAEIAGEHAHGYYLSDSGTAQDVTSTVFGQWADGGIVSSAADVARFYEALLRGDLLAPDLLAEMKTTVDTNPAWPEGHADGLGLFRSTQPCGEAWSHTGGVAGYLTSVLANDDGSRVAVVLVNGLLPDGPETAQLVDAAATAAYCGDSAAHTSPSPPAQLQSFPPAPSARLTGHVAFSGPGGAIWIQNADGTGRKQLTHPDGAVDYDPQFSPDGKRIAFSRSPLQAPDPPRQDDILVVDIDHPASEPKRLATGQHPRWFGDGSKLSFDAVAGPGIGGPSSMYSIGVDGRGRSRIKTPGIAVDEVWSPDSTTLAFTEEGPGNKTTISLIKGDGTGYRALTNLPENSVPVDWSPDGSQILISAGTPGAHVMVIVNLADGTVSPLPDLPGSESPTDWLSDGWIVFASFENDADETPSWFEMDPITRETFAVPGLQDAGDPLDWQR